MRTRSSVLCTALLLAPATAAAWQWDSAQADNLPAIGVVDIRKLINEESRYVSEQEAIDAWRIDTQKELDDATQEFQLAEAELDSYDKDSEEFTRQAQSLVGRQAELKFQLEALNEELERRRSRALKEVYQRALVACEEVRNSKSLSLVLQFNAMPVSGRSGEDVARDIVMRPVVAHSDQLDITPDVLSILNR